MKRVFLSCLLVMTGCACSRRSKIDLYRKALADTNASLTQCRDEDQALHRTVERLEKQLSAYKRGHVRNR